MHESLIIVVHDRSGATSATPLIESGCLSGVVWIGELWCLLLRFGTSDGSRPFRNAFFGVGSGDVGVDAGVTTQCPARYCFFGHISEDHVFRLQFGALAMSCDFIFLEITVAWLSYSNENVWIGTHTLVWFGKTFHLVETTLSYKVKHVVLLVLLVFNELFWFVATSILNFEILQGSSTLTAVRMLPTTTQLSTWHGRRMQGTQAPGWTTWTRETPSSTTLYTHWTQFGSS